MMKRQKFFLAPALLTAFALWTAAVMTVDVQPIGPESSTVGFAALNGFFHILTGVNWTLYTVTDWLGLVPILFVFGFALLGLAQWIQRKQLQKVDRSILILGGFYGATLGAFLFFERFVVNFRPVLIDGRLEASYPSSTTLLVMCVMPTAMMQLRGRIQNTVVRHWVMAAIAGFTVFMVTGRLLSGVHWLTDIIGGVLLSAGLVMLYQCAVIKLEETIK